MELVLHHPLDEALRDKAGDRQRAVVVVPLQEAVGRHVLGEDTAQLQELLLVQPDVALVRRVDVDRPGPLVLVPVVIPVAGLHRPVLGRLSLLLVASRPVLGTSRQLPSPSRLVLFIPEGIEIYGPGQ